MVVHRNEPSRRRRSLSLELLEPRWNPSWNGIPPATITPPGNAVNAVFNSARIATGNAAIANNEVDYFTFLAPITARFRLQASTPASSLDPVLGIFSAAGQRIAYNDDISQTNLDSNLQVNLTQGTRYYVGITNYTGSGQGSYTWRFSVPALIDDNSENNDTRATARALGTLSSVTTLTNRRMLDAADWYSFRTTRAGTASDFVQITFTHALGDLDIQLYNANGTRLATADGSGNSERISLNGRAAGTYFVRAYGYQGAHNPNYTLTIDPPTGGGNAGRTLFLNFDGANITANQLAQWSAGDWDPADLDTGNNGILVQPFLSGRGDRNQVINQLIQHVQQDLQPFNITVQRTTGLAVTGQGASTIFLGETPNDSVTHQACDVDIGNINRTDIAFVSNEDWGSTANTALAMADVTLHEAGHTWGLWHTQLTIDPNTNLYYPDSMGLRYSAPQSQWLRNTAYLNRTFQAYVDNGFPHGPGPQNAFQKMVSLFGTAGNQTVSFKEEGFVAVRDAANASIVAATKNLHFTVSVAAALFGESTTSRPRNIVADAAPAVANAPVSPPAPTPPAVDLVFASGLIGL